MRPNSLSSLFLLLLSAFAVAASGAPFVSVHSGEQQRPLNPGDFAAEGGGAPSANTVPAVPLVQAPGNRTCRLDLSDELFGGVAEACGRDLDRSRCCPVLAAWLFAAHAHAALEVRTPDGDGPLGGSDEPMMPDDSQRCVDALQSALKGRDIHLARPNASCDPVLCFCGIRLHQVSSLSCPAAFNVSSSSPPSSAYRNATPTAAVRDLERNCRNSSYAGCTRCLASLDKLAGSGGAGGGARAGRLFGRDCELMGLTWLLARNRTAYIPTVSAVLRAIMYRSHPAAGEQQPQKGGKRPQYRCSPDQENMPLAVDSLQFERLDTAAAAVPAGALGPAAALLSSLPLLFSFLTF